MLKRSQRVEGRVCELRLEHGPLGALTRLSETITIIARCVIGVVRRDQGIGEGVCPLLEDTDAGDSATDAAQ